MTKELKCRTEVTTREGNIIICIPCVTVSDEFKIIFVITPFWVSTNRSQSDQEQCISQSINRSVTYRARRRLNHPGSPIQTTVFIHSSSVRPHPLFLHIRLLLVLKKPRLTLVKLQMEASKQKQIEGVRSLIAFLFLNKFFNIV